MAVRPLRLEELAEALASDLGEAPESIPSPNADRPQEDQERAVLTTCSSLITMIPDGDSWVVQFSHFSVKEFLTSDRLTVPADEIPFYHIAPTPAHTVLALACLGVLLRVDDSTRETSVQQIPLAEYALEHWVDHALFENVSLRIKDKIEDLFDVEKPHFSRWIQLRGDMDGAYPWQDRDTQCEAAPMYYAAFCGFHDVMERLIREHPEHVSTRGGSLGTALHAASRTNHLKVVQSLLRHGADVNAPGLWGRTPLLFASECGCLEAVRWLLEHDADVNAKDAHDDWTSLHLAARTGHFEVFRTLLEHNADANAQDDCKHTPLHLASIHGRVGIVRLLLNHGADPMARDKHLETSLHKASSTGNVDIARLLLEHGADVNAVNKWRRTAYQIAFNGRRDEIAQLLSAHGGT